MSTKSFFKLLTSLILTFGVTAMCLITAYVCTSGGSFFGYEFSPAANFTHINTMLLGLDVGGTRADVMILGQLNVADGEINMLQIPRDTYVKDNGRSDKKINSAYGHNKEKTVFKEVKQITGITVNKYVAVDTSGFRNLIDTIGGVDFDVPQDMHYEDPTQDLYIHLNKGMQHLDGDKAEQLVRFRRYAKGDIRRVEVQQEFIKAVAEQKLNLSILTKLPDIFKTLQSEIKTNFSVMDIMKYLPNLKELLPENVTFHQLPGEFSGPEYEASYWLVDIPGLKTLITEVFGYDATYITTGVSGKVYSGEDRKAPKPAQTSKPTSSPKSTAKPELDVKKDEEDEYITIPDIEETPEPSLEPSPSVEPIPTPEPSQVPDDSEI